MAILPEQGMFCNSAYYGLGWHTSRLDNGLVGQSAKEADKLMAAIKDAALTRRRNTR